MQAINRKRRWLFYGIACFIAVAPFLLLIWYASFKFDVLFERYFLRYGLRYMSEQGKKEVYALLARQSPGMWDSIPEPFVGTILQKDTIKTHFRATVHSNNAGMRSIYPYIPKEPDTYRIVCLGDSLVFGMGGSEEDRFSNQMADILKNQGVTVNGKKVEVYAIGVPGWNAINEATYLSSRISEYDPDLTLVLMCTNDLNDACGVLGIGELTVSYSPQWRRYGSGVITNDWPSYLLRERKNAFNVLLFDLCLESRTRWDRTFAAWKRLETLLDRRGGRMILGVLYVSPFRLSEVPFRELCESFYEQHDMKSPLIFTDYFGNSLPHDVHPNREGHRIIAVHYLHTLASLGWLPIQGDQLPALDPRLDTVTEHPSNQEVIEQKKEFWAKKLPERIDFNNLTEMNALGILGGIYPGRADEPLEQYPDASLKSVFLLRHRKDAGRVVVEIEVPSLVELYPFTLEMRLNRQKASEIVLADEQGAGRHRLEGIIPKTDDFNSIFEVTLRTESYWTGINDPTMRSCKLISAWQE